MSTKSVLHMKQSQYTEIGAGKICGWTIKENTGNLKIEFEW